MCERGFQRVVTQVYQESACPPAEESEAADEARKWVSKLPGLLQPRVDLVRKQQIQAHVKKRPAAKKKKTNSKVLKKPAAASTSVSYNQVMKQFKEQTEKDLIEMYGGKDMKTIGKAVRSAWLDSQERVDAIASMSSSERKKRRLDK